MTDWRFVSHKQSVHPTDHTGLASRTWLPCHDTPTTPSPPATIRATPPTPRRPPGSGERAGPVPAATPGERGGRAKSASLSSCSPACRERANEQSGSPSCCAARRVRASEQSHSPPRFIGSRRASERAKGSSHVEPGWRIFQPGTSRRRPSSLPFHPRPGASRRGRTHSLIPV